MQGRQHYSVEKKPIRNWVGLALFTVGSAALVAFDFYMNH